MVVVTAKHLAAVRAAGACSDRVDLYSPGLPLANVAVSDLVWVEDNAPAVAASIFKQIGVPLWCMGSPGSGSGSGSGYGSGSGSGSGSGYGDGSGYGSGYGDGGM